MFSPFTGLLSFNTFEDSLKAFSGLKLEERASELSASKGEKDPFDKLEDLIECRECNLLKRS